MLTISVTVFALDNIFCNMEFIRLAQVKLSEDDEFIVLACDGIWYVLCTNHFLS